MKEEVRFWKETIVKMIVVDEGEFNILQKTWALSKSGNLIKLLAVEWWDSWESGAVTRIFLSFQSYLLLQWYWQELLYFGYELDYCHQNHFRGYVSVPLETTCSWWFSLLLPTCYVKLFIW